MSELLKPSVSGSGSGSGSVSGLVSVGAQKSSFAVFKLVRSYRLMLVLVLENGSRERLV